MPLRCCLDRVPTSVPAAPTRCQPCARRLLLGANTPWKRVRFTRGLTYMDVLMPRAHGCAGAAGTRAARRAMKSSGSKIASVVPSRYGGSADSGCCPDLSVTGAQPQGPVSQHVRDTARTVSVVPFPHSGKVFYRGCPHRRFVIRQRLLEETDCRRSAYIAERRYRPRPKPRLLVV